MIKKIFIKNFQCHKRLVLNLSKGINVITGSSNTGKTAILRAMEWLFFNRPGGTGFQRTGSKDTRVTITFTSGQTISRFRSKKENGYLISGTQQPILAVKGHVPEEIKKLFPIQEINLQKQLDQPFLIGNSPGKIAAYFNSIAGMEEIDALTTSIKADIRQLSSSIRGIDSSIIEQKEKLAQFPNLTKMELDIQELEAVEKEQEQESAQLSKIKSIVRQLETVKKEKSETAAYDINSAKNILAKLTKSYERYEKEKQKLQNINQLLHSINQNKERIKQAKKELKQLKEQYRENFPDICPLCGQPTKGKIK